MKIKITKRYHYTSIRTAKIKSKNSTCWQECRKIGMLILYWWEWKIVQPFCKTVCQFLWKRTEHTLTIQSNNCTLGTYPKEIKNSTQKSVQDVHNIFFFFCSSKKIGDTQNVPQRWIVRLWYTNITKCYSKREKWIIHIHILDGSQGHCVEWKKNISDHIPYDFIHVAFLVKL